MSLKRPKILTRVTVPTGGWGMHVHILTDGANPHATATLPAGNYYMRGDFLGDPAGQADGDDLFYWLSRNLDTALDAIETDAGNGRPKVGIDPTTGKVVICFRDTNYTAANDSPVLVEWTDPASSSDLALCLGFDPTVDYAGTGDYPTISAPHYPMYVWTADRDGQGELTSPSDNNHANSLQSTSISGKTKTQLIGDMNRNELQLRFLERELNSRTKVFSGGQAYGEAPVHPYNRNEPLECWFREARKGTPFLVYENANVDVTRAVETGTNSGVSTSSITDAAKTWETEPQNFAGMVLWNENDYVDGDNLNFGFARPYYILSNTATVINVTFGPIGSNIMSVGQRYYVLDWRYGEYVLDLKKMSSFEPTERPNIDCWDITIPLIKYVA